MRLLRRIRSEIASRYSLPPQLVKEWKKEFIKNAYKAFETQNEMKRLKSELEKAYEKIGQLEVEKDFLSDVLRGA